MDCHIVSEDVEKLKRFVRQVQVVEAPRLSFRSDVEAFMKGSIVHLTMVPRAFDVCVIEWQAYAAPRSSEGIQGRKMWENIQTCKCKTLTGPHSNSWVPFHKTSRIVIRTHGPLAHNSTILVRKSKHTD